MLLYSHKFRTKLTKQQIETTLLCTASGNYNNSIGGVYDKRISYKIRGRWLIIDGGTKSSRFVATIKENADGSVIKGIFGTPWFPMFIFFFVLLICWDSWTHLQVLLMAGGSAVLFAMAEIGSSCMETDAQLYVIDYIQKNLVKENSDDPAEKTEDVSEVKLTGKE